MDRTHLAAEQAAREEERLNEECTFSPDLPTKRAAEAVAAAAAAAAGREHGEEKEKAPSFPLRPCCMPVLSADPPFVR